MASKHKREDIIGYVHAISPEKPNKSFRVSIQTETAIKKAICFDASKLGKLKEKKLSGDAVMLSKVYIDDHPQKNFAEIIINNETVLDDVDIKNVKFSREHQKHAFCTLDQDLSAGSIYSVKAKLLLKHSIENTVSSRGKQLKVLNQCYLADEKGTMELSVWEEWIPYLRSEMDAGRDYFIFHNLMVRSYGSTKTLQTCSDTYAEAADSAPPTVQFNVSPTSDNRKVEIEEFDSVNNVKYWYRCSSCSKKVKASNTVLIKCDNCNSTMRSKKLEDIATVTIKCKKELGDDAYNLDITNLVCKSEGKDIVNLLMEMSNVTLKVLKVLTDTFKGAPRQSTYALPYGVLELIAPFLGAG